MAAETFERDALALVMFAAWLNVPPQDIPTKFKAHHCEATAKAWSRVAAAARNHIENERAKI